MKTLIDNYEEMYEKIATIGEQANSKDIGFFANLIDGWGGKVLDIGCAEGRLSVELAKRGHTVYAMDISSIYISRTLELAQKNGVAIHSLKADIENYDTDFRGYFDVIYLMDVIEHLRSPSRALCNIKKMLADDGVLIIHTPNIANFRKFFGYALRPKKMVDFRTPDKCGGFHLQEYDYLMLNQLLAFCGFKIKRLVPRSVLSRIFPKLGYNLLTMCEKAEPINAEKVRGIRPRK